MHYQQAVQRLVSAIRWRRVRLNRRRLRNRYCLLCQNLEASEAALRLWRLAKIWQSAKIWGFFETGGRTWFTLLGARFITYICKQNWLKLAPVRPSPYFVPFWWVNLSMHVFVISVTSTAVLQRDFHQWKKKTNKQTNKQKKNNMLTRKKIRLIFVFVWDR